MDTRDALLMIADQGNGTGVMYYILDYNVCCAKMVQAINDPSCAILYDNDDKQIIIVSDDVIDELSYCPFCGKKLVPSNGDQDVD